MPTPQIQSVATEYKPWGLTAGAITGQEQYDKEAANLQALRESQLGNVIKQVEADRAQSDFARPGLENLRQKSLEGGYQSTIAKGATDAGTQQAVMQQKISEALAGKSKADIEHTVSQLDNFIATSQSGPDGFARALETMDPQMKQKAIELETKQPGSALKMAQTYSELLKNNLASSPAVRGKMLEQTHQGTITEGIRKSDRASHEKIAGGDNATILKSMQMQIDAGRFNKSSSQLDAISMLVKQGRYEGAAVGLSMLAMQEEDPVKKQQLLQQAAMYEQMAKEKAAAGAVKPGAIDQSAVSGLPGQQQTPSRILNQTTQQGTKENPIVLK